MNLVSVVVIGYPPHFKFLPTALSSIASQSITPYEIVIVLSEVSSDIFPEILQASSLSNVRFYCQKYRKNAAENRNIALSLVKGDFVMFCDADDFIHPDKIEICLRQFSSHPDLAAVVNSYEVINDRQWVAPEKLVSNLRLLVSIGMDQNTEFDIAHGNPFIKVSAVNSRFSEELDVGEDMDFLQKIILSGFKVGFLNVPLIGYFKQIT